jgi:hypothetical protein
VRHVCIIGRGICLAAAAQSDSLVQQLGHGLVVSVVLSLGPGLDETVVLKLGQSLGGETLGGGEKGICDTANMVSSRAQQNNRLWRLSISDPWNRRRMVQGEQPACTLRDMPALHVVRIAKMPQNFATTCREREREMTPRCKHPALVKERTVCDRQSSRHVPTVQPACTPPPKVWRPLSSVTPSLRWHQYRTPPDARTPTRMHVHKRAHKAAAHLDPEALSLALQVSEAHATNAAHTAGEGGVHNLLAQTIRLKDLQRSVTNAANNSATSVQTTVRPEQLRVNLHTCQLTVWLLLYSICWLP